MNRKSLCSIVVALLVLLLAGCASAPTAKKTRYFWPAVPDTPRFEWLANYYSERSFERTDLEKSMSYVIGDQYATAMGRPMDVVSDGKGRVYVSDIGLRKVRLFDFVERTADYLDLESLTFPFGLAIDTQGSLFIVEKGRKAVYQYSRDHKFLGSYGGKGVLENPSFAALDEVRRRLYVSDSKTHIIAVFDLDSREHLFSFGDKGAPNEKLYGPQGVAVDKNGNIFVCDTLNSRIVSYSSEGVFLSTFGELGAAIYAFEFPKDLAFDSDGNLHIFDARKASILSYSPDGEFLLFLGSGKTSHPLGFTLPGGLCVDARDRIYAADQLQRRFSEWQYFSEKYLAEHPNFWKE